MKKKVKSWQECVSGGGGRSVAPLFQCRECVLQLPFFFLFPAEHWWLYCPSSSSTTYLDVTETASDERASFRILKMGSFPSRTTHPPSPFPRPKLFVCVT